MSFQPVFPIPLIAALAGLSALAAVVLAVRGRQPQPRWVHFPVLLLRFATIAAITMLLLNPARRIVTPVPETRNLMLIDTSASMGLGPHDSPDRLTEGLAWTESALAAVKDAGLPAPELFVFADQTAAAPESTEARAALRPSGDTTLLATNLERTATRSGSKPADQVIVISDGCLHDRDALARSLGNVTAAGASVSTHLVGTDTPPRNAWISAVQAPRIVRPRATASVHVGIDFSGIARDESLRLELSDAGGKVLDSALLRPDDDTSSHERTLTLDAGLRTASYSLSLLPLDGEVATDDNRFEFTIEVASTKLRVLFVEGTHVKRTIGTDGHWWNDMELITRVWDASGEIEYLCLTPVSEYSNTPNLVGVTFHNGEMLQDSSQSFPATREELYSYDVMLISDVPVGNFSNEQMQWVVDWVNERGGGFLMGGGYTTFDVGHYDQTPWEKIIPVDMLTYGAGFMERGFKIAIPESVRDHPIWRISEDPAENNKILDAHPWFHGMNRVRRAKPGAIVLATWPESNNEPVFAAQSYGRGRSIAYLPDPNGGWAHDSITWGPPGGSPIGRHTELGHGGNFVFKKDFATGPDMPQPPHPSPWYGRFWLNVTQWLGENSVRWRRDQLAGRTVTATATPGSDLPVAVEVLAVTSPDEMLGLDVGVRFDLPDSPRIRLEYDRDRREFTGKIPVPDDVPGGKLTVLFDTNASSKPLTDAIEVGLRRGNREFIDSAPDAEFMTDLARAGGGRSLDAPEEVVALIRQSLDRSARQGESSHEEPLWPRLWVWAAITALLTLEWLLRRRSFSTLITASLVLFTLLPLRLHGAEVAAEIPALIEQLGHEKVRLRDEAETALAGIPAAAGALKDAATNHDSLEVRLRAGQALATVRQATWSMTGQYSGHATGAEMNLHGLVVSSNGSRFYTRGQDLVRAWNAETMEPLESFGPRVGMWGRDWKFLGPISTLAISPDGKTLVCSDDIGTFELIDTESAATKATLTTISVFENLGETPVPFSAAFSPDGKRLVVGTTGGILLHINPATGELVEAESKIALNYAACLAFSPDSRYLVVSDDTNGEPDFIRIRDMKEGRWCFSVRVPDLVYDLAFNADGSLLASVDRRGVVTRWDFVDGRLGDHRQLLDLPSVGNSATFSPDGKSLWVTSDDPDLPLIQIDAVTGEELWRSGQIPGGCRIARFLDEDRIVATCGDLLVRVWKHN